MGRDESAAHEVREAVESDERSSSAGCGLRRGVSYREGVATPKRMTGKVALHETRLTCGQNS